MNNPPEPKGYFLSNRLYNYTKLLAQLILPAVGAMYFSLAGIWGLPSADEVVGTIVVVDTFLGVLLSVSTNSYNNSDTKFDGTMAIANAMDGRKTFSLELEKPPEHLEHKDQITFKIQRPE